MVVPEPSRVCVVCKKSIVTKSNANRFACSPCRTAARAAKATGQPASVPDRSAQAGAVADSVTVATRAALAAVDRPADDPLAAIALSLALLLDVGAGSPSGLASVARELRATLEEITRNAPAAADPVQQVAQQRAARHAGLRLVN